AWQSCGESADHTEDDAHNQADFEPCDGASSHVQGETEAQAEDQISDDIWPGDANGGCQADDDAEGEAPAQAEAQTERKTCHQAKQWYQPRSEHICVEQAIDTG